MDTRAHASPEGIVSKRRSASTSAAALSDQRQLGLLHLPFDRFEHRLRVCRLRHRGRLVVDPIVDIRMILA
jgi:hypothetical protein